MVREQIRNDTRGAASGKECQAVQSIAEGPLREDGVVFARGGYAPREDTVIRYILDPGLYVSFVVQGQFHIKIGDQWRVVEEKTCSCILKPASAEHFCFVRGGHEVETMGAFFSKDWFDRLEKSQIFEALDISPLHDSDFITLADMGVPAMAIVDDYLRTDMPEDLRGPFRSIKAVEFLLMLVESVRKTRRVPASRQMAWADLARVAAARDLLEDRLGAPPTLAELSAAVGLTAKKLNQGFKHLYGLTVFDYLTDLRLKTAYRLISEGRERISVVAYKVGVMPAHLSYAFRKRFGISPSALRRSAAAP